MASTYSDLKIELIATGEQSGTWGTTTNNNLGNAALGEAITGSADVAFSSADVTVTLTDTNASQTARNLRLNLTGTTGGARSLILGSGCQIEKLYLVNNTCADAITVKNTSGTGIAVAAGKSMFVYNNGTNVVEAVTQFNGTIALASGVSGVLPIANGGTGTSSTTFTDLATNVTGTLPIANGGTGSTSTTFVNAATNITGTLPIANGGTGATSLAAATIATLGYTTTATAAGTTTLTASSTATQFFTGATTQTVVLPVASTMTLGQQFTIHNNSTGALTVNSSGSNLVATINANTTANITCILTSGTTAASWDADFTGFTTALTVARGGTGASTLTSNNVLLGNGTDAVTFVAPGSNGNILTSNGSTWTSAAASGGGSFQTQIFTSPGTWTKPASATQVRVTVVGGGGSSYIGPGGDGGLGVSANIPVSAPVSVTVGAGGAAQPGGGVVPGGTSSFGPAVSATGGTGGGGSPSQAAPGSSTVSSGTDLRSGTSAATYRPNPLYGATLRSQGQGGSAIAYSVSSNFMAGAGGIGAPNAPSFTGAVGGVVIVEFVG
jgi:hypothetical protein